MKLCATCGSEAPIDAAFCGRCGARLGEACSSCGRTLPDGARFCVRCGAPRAGGGSTVPGALDLPESLDLLPELIGENRLVTVMFADMSGSVRRTKDLHHEDATELVSRLLQIMVDVVVRYEGRIDRFLGDGVLAVFGVPLHEDDAERAVRTALEIREGAVDLGLGVTAGINTGEVYFGPVGPEAHREVTVMGPVVNLAARLQGLAAEGGILIGEDTGRHVRHAFALERVELAVKGMDGAVPAFRVDRMHDRPERVRGIEGLRAPLTGRDRELAELTGLEAAATTGPGELVYLVGEAGLGKSRLIEEARTGSDARWFYARCLELQRTTAFGPCRGLLASLAEEQGGLAPLMADLAAGGQLPEDRIPQSLPFLEQLVAADPAAADPSPAISAQERRSLTTAALVDVVAGLAVRQPSVLVIDDLHWADPQTHNFLERLNARLATIPLLVIAAMRPEGQAVPGAHRRINLRPLTTDEGRALVGSILSAAVIPPELEAEIVERAGGNPFFVEEIIRAHIQQGFLRRNNGAWEATAPTAHVPIPDTVHALVMRRVDGLALPYRRTAQVASVLGAMFSRRHLADTLGRPPDEALSLLEDGGFVVAGLADDTYSFAHALTHEAIYRSLLPSQASALHERAGEALVGREAEPASVEAMAHHFSRSRNDARAVHYLALAGRNAAAAFLNDAALDHFETALARAQAIPETAVDHLGQIHAGIGEINGLLGHYDASIAALSTAASHFAGDALAAARAHRLRGKALRESDRFEAADQACADAEAALDLSPDRNAPEHRRAWIDVQVERMHAFYFGGRGSEIPDLLDRVGPALEVYGTREQRVDAMLGELMHRFQEEHYVVTAGTVELAHRCVAMAQDGDSLERHAEALMACGFALAWADRITNAVTTLRQGAELGARVGDLMLETRAAAYLAVSLRRAGDVPAAHEASLRALDLAERVGSRYYAGHARANLCWVAWRRGEIAAARREGAQAIAAWGEHEGSYRTEFPFLAVWPLVKIELEAGNVERAVEFLRALRAPWTRPMPPDLDAAVAAATEAHPDEAATLVRRSLELARKHRQL